MAVIYNAPIQQDMDHRTSWMHKRGITDEVIEKFGIELVEDSPVGKGIKIPVRNAEGVVLFNKYRRDPLSDEKPKYAYDRGGKVSLFGLHELVSNENDLRTLLTEGEMDCLVAHSKSINALTSTGGAMSFQAEWSWLNSEDTIIAFDNDDAGAQGTVRVLKHCPDARVLLIPEASGVKDISDYVERGGDLHRLIETARQYNGIEDVREERMRRIATWLPVRFHDAYIKQWEEDNHKAMRLPRVKTGIRVEDAKAYPITNLLKFNRERKAVCPFHSEKTGSLHLYKEQNRTWCFGGCGKGYDAIDIYMKTFGVDFKTAVKELNDLR